jgi:hypothetical protein
MNRVEQINEMSDEIEFVLDHETYDDNSILAFAIANTLHNADYRKQGDVARKILSDLKKTVHNKAVYTSLGTVNYIPLKTFDAIVQQYINENTEGKK